MPSMMSEEREALETEERALKEALERLQAKPSERLETSGPASDLSSSALRDIEEAQFQVRSFVQSVRVGFERASSNVVEEVLLASTLGARIADYLVRRALFDSKRVLSGVATTMLPALGVASERSTSPSHSSSSSSSSSSSTSSWLEDDSLAPFKEQLSSIERTRARSGDETSTSLFLLEASNEERQAAVASKRRAEREQATREEVSALLTELWDEGTQRVGEALSIAAAAAADAVAKAIEPATPEAASTAVTAEAVAQQISFEAEAAAAAEAKERALAAAKKAWLASGGSRAGVDGAAEAVQAAAAVAEEVAEAKERTENKRRQKKASKKAWLASGGSGAGGSGAGDGQEAVKAVKAAAAEAAETDGAEAAVAAKAPAEAEAADAAVAAVAATAAATSEVKEAKEAEASERLAQRLDRLGKLFGEAFEEAAEATQTDFASFVSLRDAGALPTIAEELQLPALPPSLAEPLRAALPPSLSGSSGAKSKALGAFANQAVPSQQRQQRQQRLEFELASRQVGLATSLGARATKDASDAIAFGVLPAARSIGKVAMRRLPYLLPAEGGPKAGAQLPSLKAADVLSELAVELTLEYKRSMQQGVQAGLLPSVDVAAGETRRIAGKQLAAAAADLLGRVRVGGRRFAGDYVGLVRPTGARALGSAPAAVDEARAAAQDGGGGGGGGGRSNNADGQQQNPSWTPWRDGNAGGSNGATGTGVEPTNGELLQMLEDAIDVIEVEAAWVEAIGVVVPTTGDGDAQDYVVSGVTSVMEEAVEIDAIGAARWWPSTPSRRAGQVDVMRTPRSTTAEGSMDTVIDGARNGAQEDAVVSAVLDVEAQSSADDEEAARKQLLTVLDALLFLVEVYVSKALTRLEVLSPPTEEMELAKPWRRLGMLGDEAALEQQRVNKAQLALATALERSLNRS